MSNSRFGFRSRKGEIRSFIEGNVAILYDADAQAFINAAGITATTQQSAINTLVVDLKSQSLWTKFNAIYPFVGGTATTHKFNLINPADTDAAFRLSFVGGWTHSANGAQGNGTNGYANTFINALNNIFNLSTHLSIYSRSQTVGTQVEIGAWDNFTGGARFYQLRAATNSVFGSTISILFFTTTADARGFWIATKRANNDREAYLNGISQTTSTTNDTETFPNLNLFISARNDFGAANVFSNKQLAFASVGSGLTDAEVTTLNTIIQTFQTTLGRQV